MGVDLHGTLADGVKNRLDGIILVCQCLGDLAQGVQGLGGAVDDLSDSSGGEVVHRLLEVVGVDLLVERPRQVVDVGNGVAVHLLGLAVECSLQRVDVGNAMVVLDVGLAVEGVVQVDDVTHCVRVREVGLVVEACVNNHQVIRQRDDLDDFVVVLDVGLAVEGVADTGHIVNIADLGDDQLAKRERVALGWHGDVDNDVPVVGVMKRHAKRSRLDVDGSATVLVEDREPIKRARHTTASRRARRRGGQRNRVALDRGGGHIVDVDKQSSH